MEIKPESNSASVIQESLMRKVFWLSSFTVVYNLIEGIVSISFGMQDDSISLLGFGVDSLIEVTSAAVVLWRFRGEIGRAAEYSLERERKSTFAIGTLFCLLGVGIFFSSLLQFQSHSHPETTVPGIIISTLSLSFMLFLWKGKERVGKQLNSSTVLKDARCSLACIKLSAVLLVGSLLYSLKPELWWADSLAGSLLALLIAKEGWDTILAARSPDFGGGCGCE